LYDVNRLINGVIIQYLQLLDVHLRHLCFHYNRLLEWNHSICIVAIMTFLQWKYGQLIM